MFKQDYQKLKQIIQEANPEKFGQGDLAALQSTQEGQSNYAIGFDGKVKDYTIRLADVLLAMSDPDFEENLHQLLVLWNLKDNDIDHQSDECKKFLIELLVK